jgi:hypothetical protein
VQAVESTTVTRRRRVRERDLQGHFTHDEADPEADDGQAADGAESAEEGPPDVQLTRAVEVLKSWTYFDALRAGPPVAVVDQEPAEVAAPEAE